MAGKEINCCQSHIHVQTFTRAHTRGGRIHFSQCTFELTLSLLNKVFKFIEVQTGDMKRETVAAKHGCVSVQMWVTVSVRAHAKLYQKKYNI